MNIEYVARNCRLEPELKSFAEERLGKILRFVGEPVEVHLGLEVEKHRTIAELRFRHRHGDLHAREETDDLRDAVAQAMEKIEKQARRSHKKFLSSRRKGSVRNGDWSMEVVEAQSIGADEGPKVIEASMLQVKPMAIEEAVLQLRDGEQEFLVFRNSEVDQISVLYKRRDGNYGLITPED